MKKILLFIILVVVLIVFGYFTFLFYSFSDAIEQSDHCVMNVGPIYGDTVPIIAPPTLEEEIQIPKGKFGFLHLTDTLSPILIKFDSDNVIQWAIEFKADSSLSLPYQRLSGFEMKEDEYGIRLHFSTIVQENMVRFTLQINMK